jgi:hypothetical protein
MHFRKSYCGRNLTSDDWGFILHDIQHILIILKILNVLNYASHTANTCMCHYATPQTQPYTTNSRLLPASEHGVR